MSLVNSSSPPAWSHLVLVFVLIWGMMLATGILLDSKVQLKGFILVKFTNGSRACPTSKPTLIFETSRSVLACSVECAKDESCMSYSFYSDTSRCVVYTGDAPPDGYIPVKNCMNYVVPVSTVKKHTVGLLCRWSNKKTISQLHQWSIFEKCTCMIKYKMLHYCRNIPVRNTEIIENQRR